MAQADRIASKQIDYWDFYNRQVNCLGVATQKRLSKKTIAVVGMGGLGSHLLQSLAMIGLKKIHLIDGDIVALHNLHRQPLYTLDDIDKPKAYCAKEFWEARNPFTQFVAHNMFLDQDNIDVLDGIDLMIDGTDSNDCTMLLNAHCVENQIPLIAGNVEQQGGFAGVFAGHYKEEGCYACLFPEFPDHVRTCAEAGVDPRAVALIAQIQSDLAIETLLNPLQTAGKIIRFGSAGERFNQFKSPLNATCFVCSGVTKTIKEVEMNQDNDIKIVDDIPEGFQFIDVRTIEEFEDSPREALNIPLDQLANNPDAVPDGDMVICCASGKRSLMAAQFLKEIGRKETIYVLNQS